MAHTLADTGVASRILSKKSRGQRSAAISSAVSDVTHWTSKTGLSMSRVTNTNGVSTIAQQRRQKREQERQAHDRQQKRREQEECRLLRVKIKTCRKNVDKAKERLRFLRQNNKDIVQEISSTEQAVMSHVNSLVHRYGQYATATATINQRFTGTLEQAKADLKAFESTLGEQVSRMRADVDNLQQRIDQANRNLRALLLYKESGQLEMRRTIFNLKEHLDRLRSQQMREMQALNVEMGTLRDNMQASWQDTVEGLNSQASAEVLQSLPPSTRATMLENMHIRQELEKHSADLAEAEARMTTLEEENSKLREQYAETKLKNRLSKSSLQTRLMQPASSQPPPRTAPRTADSSEPQLVPPSLLRSAREPPARSVSTPTSSHAEALARLATPRQAKARQQEEEERRDKQRTAIFKRQQEAVTPSQSQMFLSKLQSGQQIRKKQSEVDFDVIPASRSLLVSSDSNVMLPWQSSNHGPSQHRQSQTWSAAAHSVAESRRSTQVSGPSLSHPFTRGLAEGVEGGDRRQRTSQIDRQHHAATEHDVDDHTYHYKQQQQQTQGQRIGERPRTPTSAWAYEALSGLSVAEDDEINAHVAVAERFRAVASVASLVPSMSDWAADFQASQQF